MSTKTHGALGMGNSSPAMAEQFVEVEARAQALLRDLESLKKHLSDPLAKPGVGARVLACMLSAAVLAEWLVRLQITALSE